MMQRNWDTIREMLVEFEKIDVIQDRMHLRHFDPTRRTEIAYHAELILEAGLAVGKVNRNIGPGPYDFTVERLTWAGHELLDSIRSETVWEKTKKSFVSKGVSITVDVLKAVASEIAVALVKSGIT